MPKTASAAPEGAARLQRRLSPLAVWALSFGCSVGWGAFVMPGTTFLPLAGPLGTALGMAVGALIMLVIGVNYHILMNRYPEAGGTFSYTKYGFGFDHGFLASWFLVLVYLAILWANATAIPLICRGLFGPLLQFGFHYTVAGYEVWGGELLVTLLTLLVIGLCCYGGGKAASWLQIALAVLLFLGVLAAAAAVLLPSQTDAAPELRPLFAPARRPGAGIAFIACLSPWAFAGFESISNSAEEFRFSPKKSLGIMVAALFAAALAYILLALIAAARSPEGFGTWEDYVSALDSQEGLKALPVFYNVHRAAGTPGLVILGAATAAGILTGFLGTLTAASRLTYALARDGLLPRPLAALNRGGVPGKAVVLLLLISLPIIFLGRSAIGWVIDVNTIGVSIAYVYTSAAALHLSRQEKHAGGTVFGILGIAFSGFFLLYFLIPHGRNAMSSLPTESYLMLMAWSVLGFVVFYFIFRRDRGQHLGESTLIWIVLLLLIFFTSMVWVTGATKDATTDAVAELRSEYVSRQPEGEVSQEELEGFAQRLRDQFTRVTNRILLNTVIQFLLVLVSLLIIFHIYGTVQKQKQSAVQDKTLAEQNSQAKTAFLSNMSHDIRTPMNAIIGYVTLARREKDLSPRMADYLGKIEASSDHLLALINDVLEMSRIESGRMELLPVPTDVRRMMEDVRSLFSTQMEQKGLDFQVSCQEVADSRVLCDQNRMNRVLLNLISNAYKFTPAGGTVAVTLRQTGRTEERADFRLSVKDTGTGMSPEFAARVFDAYARERTADAENIQGTGLGTAITKSIVELMGGSIQVHSRLGEGSEFVVRVSLPLDTEAGEALSGAGQGSAQGAFRGLRLLLAEDDPDNRNVEKTLLESAGFTVDTVANGEDAVETVAASAPGEYAAVLLDIEMPVKDGYQTAALIRSLKNPALAGLPIVAVSARAFSEDTADALKAGMDGYIAKPINLEKALETLGEVLRPGPETPGRGS